jgi:hypothetical protein
MEHEDNVDVSEEALLYRQAVLGKQVEDFINCDVGKYIISLALIEKEEALAKLAVCDPEDVAAVRALQNQIRMRDDFRGWLQDAVARGLQAVNIIESRE